MKNEIRMYLAEIILGWVIRIAPNNTEGLNLKLLLWNYYKAKLAGK